MNGLHYNRFRYYDPVAGEYVSQDPIGLRGGFRLHSYVDDPLSWTDLLGLEQCSPTITADDLTGKTRTEIEQMAGAKGLIPFGQPDPITGRSRKWKDPVTGKQRMRLDRGHTDPTTGLPYNDPRTAADHVHGYEPDGAIKVRSPDGNPHFPTVGE